MKTKTLQFARLLRTGGILLFFMLLGNVPVFAAQQQIFGNEQLENNANKQVLDFDNTGGNVILQFGAALGEQLYWDNTGGQFIFTDDANVQGNLDVDGTITAGSSNVQLTNAAGKIDGEQIADDTIDDDSVDFGMGGDQVGADDLTAADTFDNSNSTNVQSVLDDLDAAITTGGAATSTGTTSNSYIIDTDNNGVNPVLQFGAALAETLTWNNAASRFDLSDDLNVTGTITSTGTINGVGLSTTSLDFNGNATVGDGLNSVAIDGTSWDVSGTGTATGLSLDADTNTVTNIENADIKAGANIDFSKLATRTKTMAVQMNDLTIQTDGTNNLANLYTDSETGANPHQFYILKSQQATLQDTNLVIKAKLPTDFVSFANSGDLSFSYKNTGTNNTDSKIDILVKDKDGDNAFTASDGQNLFSTSWATYTDEFDGVSFNPTAGDYIYLTLTGYASKDLTVSQDAYLGEVVLTYTGK